MYAIVDIAGQQFKVSKDDQILVPQMKGEVGDKVQFDQVLLVARDDEVKIGQPTVEGSLVEATIVGFERGKKVVVFKKKRRKGYRVKKGHRQGYTKVKIEDILT